MPIHMYLYIYPCNFFFFHDLHSLGRDCGKKTFRALVLERFVFLIFSYNFKAAHTHQQTQNFHNRFNICIIHMLKKNKSKNYVHKD